MPVHSVVSLLGATILTLFAVISAHASTPATPAPASARVDAPVLVRVTRLSGIGPDGRETVLFTGRGGRLVSLMDMSGLEGFEPALTEGAYHGLRAEITNELRVTGPAGQTLTTAFSTDGTTPVLRLAGTVVVAGTEVHALGLVPDFILAGQVRPGYRHAPCAGCELHDGDDD